MINLEHSAVPPTRRARENSRRPGRTRPGWRSEARLVYGASLSWGGRVRPPLRDFCWCPDNFLHQRIRVALVLGDLRRVTLEAGTVYLLARFFELRCAHHIDYPLLPVLDVLLEHEFLFLQIRLVVCDRFRQLFGPNALGCDRLDDRRRPSVVARGQRLHGANLALDALGALAV